MMIAPIASVPVADLELQLLLEAVFRFSGYDFRDYAPATLKRRVAERMRAEEVRTLSGLQEKILHDLAALDRLVYGLSVTTTTLFRDPTYFRALREIVVPRLRTFPLSRIWVCGASTGEEVYSLAILLHESNLAHRCRIYATDVSETAIDAAKAGRFPIEAMEAAAARYAEAGGTRDLTDYVTREGLQAVVAPWLRDNIVFATHNLASDSSFNEFTVIVCRGVLTHFNTSLLYRAHQVILESLTRFGYLALGMHESLKNTPHQRVYEDVAGAESIYRRIR
jgi:chemotaxis protein methyltransferase CheR